MVDDYLTWDIQIEHISKKVRQNISVIKHIRTCMSNALLIMVYRILVESYFTYCNTTWGGQLLIDKLQALPNTVARVVSRIGFEEANHNLV